MILNQGDLSIEQVKLLCEIYLDSTKREDTRRKLARKDAQVPEVPEGKTEVEVYISNFLKEFNLVSESSKFYGFLYEHLSRMNLSGIISLYANTNAMKKKISYKLYEVFGRTPDETALANIHKKFVEVTETTYNSNFVVEVSPLGYLSNAYDRFFQNSYSRFINSQMNVKGNTFVGAEGDLEDVADFDERGDLNDIKSTFDIPNFKQIAYTIYEGTKALKYDKNPDGSFMYDIFSYKKSLIVEERFNRIKDNLEKRSSTLKQVFELEDINKNVAGGSAPKRWNHRKNILQAMSERSFSLTLEEPFEEIYRLYGNEKQTNTGFVFLREDTDPTTEKINKLNAAQTFLKIRQGLNACDELIRLLRANNIDPLAVPSDIFRDETWLSKVSNFKAYMLMYDNIKELDTDEKVNGNIYNNNELFKHIQLNELRGIVNRDLGAIGNIVNGDLSACSYPTLNSFIRTNKNQIQSLKNDVKTKAKVFNDLERICMQTLDMLAVLTKGDYIREIRKNKIIDWKYPPEGYAAKVRQMYESGCKLPPEKLHPAQRAFLKNYNTLETFGANRLQLDINKESFFNDLLTCARVVVRLGEGILNCLNILDEDYLSDIRIIDMIDVNKNLISIDKTFSASRDLANINQLQGDTVTIPKRSNINDSYKLIDRNVNVSLNLYAEAFKFLKDVSDKVTEHGRRGYHSTQFILGTHESTLVEYGKIVSYTARTLQDRQFVFAINGLPRYKGFILHSVGKPIVKIFIGHKYYLHKSGYWITGELDIIKDENAKIRFSADDKIM